MNIETADRLIELRKRKGLSQEDLARELGISRQAVSKWERAEAGPDVDNAILLSRLYNISLDELFGNKPEYERELDGAEEAPEEEERSEAFADDNKKQAPSESASPIRQVGESAFEGVKKLICAVRANVDIEGVEGDICSLTMEGPQKEIDRCSVIADGDTLRIESEKEKYGFFGIWSKLKIHVCVPVSVRRIEAALRGGDLQIKGVSSGAIAGHTGGGDIKVLSCEAEKLELKTGGGDVKLSTVSTGYAEIVCGGGNVEADELVSNGAAAVYTGGGDITLNGAGAKIEAKSGGGDINVDVSAEEIEVKSGGGDIVIRASEAGSVNAKTGGGDITASLDGCRGVRVDLATAGGEAKLYNNDQLVASGKRLNAALGEASTEAVMRSGGGDIKLIFND